MRCTPLALTLAGAILLGGAPRLAGALNEHPNAVGAATASGAAKAEAPPAKPGEPKPAEGKPGQPTPAKAKPAAEPAKPTPEKPAKPEPKKPAKPEPEKPKPKPPVWEPVRALLQRPIVGPALPLAEVQRYCDAAVVRMPEVKTAADWDKEAARLRDEVLRRVVFCGEAEKWRQAPVQVQWLDTIPGGPGYRLKKLRYEALPGLWIPAILYEPEKLSGKVPVVLNVNGHVGGPGKAYEPKQIRCINQAKRGMIALNPEWVGMGQLGTPGYHHVRMNQLDLCGTSGVAVHYLAMSKAIDLLLALEHADPKRVAAAGLSGGGWQTIFIAGLDWRVTLANPVAGYSSFRTRAMNFSDLGDPEQTPNDLGMIADYIHLTAMRAPRPTLLTKNLTDNCCFAAPHALPPLLAAVKPIYKLYGKPDNLRAHVNADPGDHNFGLDNREALYRAFQDFFYDRSPSFNSREIPCEKELKTFDELKVPLPEKNHDFHTLALELMKPLPRDGALPHDKAAAQEWQKARRAKLREVVRAKDFPVTALRVGQEEQAGTTAVFWKLQMGTAWTVPVVELARGGGKPGPAQPAVIVVADGGRQSAAEAIDKLLAAGRRVLAVDPFYFGESKITSHDWLFALLVATVGDRPLGLQASQLAAVARWAAGQQPGSKVTLVALGPRTGTAALVAAALETEAIGAVEVDQPLASLKQLIEDNVGVNEKPELFCFGLLEVADVKQMAALVAPRPVKFRNAAARAKTDLAGLAEWYALWGAKFDPLASE